MLPTARRGDVCLCVYVPVLECSIPLGWGLCVCFLCVCVRGCACVSVWNDASPCLVCDVSTHTTGQLTARQHSVYACAFVCVMGRGSRGGVIGGKRKEEGLFVSRRRLAAGSH